MDADLFLIWSIYTMTVFCSPFILYRLVLRVYSNVILMALSGIGLLLVCILVNYVWLVLSVRNGYVSRGLSSTNCV